MRIRQSIHSLLGFSVPLVTLALFVGCPHRSPVFSPDGRHLIVLAGGEGEKLDEPATQLWLVRRDAEKYSPKRIPAPGGADGDTRFLAASWLDRAQFTVMTVSWNAEDEEAVEGSEALWTVRADTLEWSAYGGPPPSVERVTRRLPVAIAKEPGGPAAALVYPVGDDAVAVVSRSGGKVLARLEPAELVGPGPGGGFLIYRVDQATGENVLVAYGSDLKARWQRGFADLSADIAGRLGKKTSDIVFNDTNISASHPSGRTVAVQLIFTDVNWKDGVSGYCAILDATNGELKSVAHATCLPGLPSLHEAKNRKRWAWTVTPAGSRSEKKTARILALPIPATGDGQAPVSLELPGVPLKSVHGYRLDPKGTRFAVSINGTVPRILVYPVDTSRVTGKPVEIRLE